MKVLIYFLLILLFLFFFVKPKFNSDQIAPVNLTKIHVCASDSMIIINYKGPKAQILWRDGTRSFYCEVKEAFYDVLDHAKGRLVKGFFVQDFSLLDWDSYVDKWIVASDAFYVIDSNKNGAMGITYVPFSDIKIASDFLLVNGGCLVKFVDINLDVLSNSSNLLRDRIIY